MAISDFADVEATHRAYVEEIAVKRRTMVPITLALRFAFAISRVFGFEYKAFKRFIRPISKGFEDNMKSAFDGYEPTEHDVFVCSFAKSGTNWMMQVVHQIANRGEGEFEEIMNVVAWPDSPVKELAIDLNDPRPVEFSPTGLRAIKTHSDAQYVPYSEKAKYVCVVRDPKDVVVSAYHFFRSVMLGPLLPSVETWVKLWREGTFGSWGDFASSYWAWRDRPNVFFITYEELNKDTTGAIIKIAELMNVELTEDELAKIVRLSSFDYMKSVDHKFYPGELSPFADGGGRMVRSGKYGRSGEVLSSQQQAIMDEYCSKRLQELGSDFPYEEYYGSAG